MVSLSSLRWLFVLLTLCGAIGSSDYLVTYEESASTYVDFPQDDISRAVLQNQPVMEKVHLQLWTTADDFQHPLFYLVKGIVRRLDKELLSFEPSYYLHDGTSTGCRLVDPVTSRDQENTEEPGCRENCTNYGRYCAASAPEDPSLVAKINGAGIVEESLRQLCVWVVYGKTGGDNMLHFFRYVNDLLLEQCDQPFSKNCTNSVMEHIGISPHFIERCMDHTHGLNSDQQNPYLKTQVENAKDLTPAQVPTLKINHDWYDGDESTAEIFKAVCAAYPEDKQPIACDFCKDCEDVRFCLWHLQCGGDSFAMYAAAKQNGNYVPDSDGIANGDALNAAPGDLASPSDAPAVDALINDNFQREDEESTSGDQNDDSDIDGKSQAQKSLISGIFVGLVIGLLVSSLYYCRDRQAKLMLQEIIKEDQLNALKPKKSVGFETSAEGMKKRLKELEAMIDGGRDVANLLDNEESEGSRSSLRQR